MIVVAGIGFHYYLKAARFDIEQVATLPRANVFYDREGNTMELPDTGSRKTVVRSEIPGDFVNALMAREDARFYQHGGVDFRGLARAAVRNLRDKNFTQGASTISMQLARNVYEMREKSLNRKAVEIALTMRMESRYTKDEILTSYLNRIYFGSGAYGIAEAADIYFGKKPQNLHPGECAMLAGIIRGPHIFSPLRNFPAAIEQRNQTLARMVEAGFLTLARAQEIQAMKIVLNEQSKDGGVQRSYVLQMVKRELESIMEKENILMNGLKVHTTLDLGWQTRLEAQLNTAVRGLENEKHWSHPTHSGHAVGDELGYLQYAAVTSETKSGAILAWIGGRDFSHSTYDRTRAKRDLGAAFEPFVAAAAAERGKLVMPGRPMQTGRQIGVAEVQRLAKRCGISGPFVDSEDLLRGAVSATPLEMSVGLATLGNKGKKPDPYFISRITDHEGRTIYQAKPTGRQALSKSAAEEAQSVLTPSSGTKTFIGATGSERDAWVLRLGPSGSTAIWIGFDRPKQIAPEQRVKALLGEFVKRLDN